MGGGSESNPPSRSTVSAICATLLINRPKERFAIRGLRCGTRATSTPDSLFQAIRSPQNGTTAGTPTFSEFAFATSPSANVQRLPPLG